MNNKSNKWAFIIGLYLFLALRPNFTWSLPNSFFYFLQIIPIVIFATKLDLRKSGNGFYFVIFLALFLFVVLLRGYNVSYAAVILSFALIPVIEKRFTVKAMDYFSKIYAIIVGISMVVFLLVRLGIMPGGRVIEPLNEYKNYYYTSYLFLVIPNTFENYFRFHGPFDEPGVIGTVGLLLLVINKFNLKSFWNVIILISGILSFSFAFYGGTIVYLVVRYITNRERTVLFLLFSVLAFYLITMNIPIFKDTIYSRMEYDEQSGRFVGDNRTGERADDYFSSIRGTSVYFWGVKQSSEMEDMIGSASYKKAITTYGLVFFILYVVLFWAFAIHNKLTISQFLIFAAIMLVNLYHRPNMLDFVYIFLNMSYIKARACDNEDVIIEKQVLTA